jgi:hypothetical protein
MKQMKNPEETISKNKKIKKGPYISKNQTNILRNRRGDYYV